MDNMDFGAKARNPPHIISAFFFNGLRAIAEQFL